MYCVQKVRPITFYLKEIPLKYYILMSTFSSILETVFIVNLRNGL